MTIARLRCGSDIRAGLKQAGIAGDFYAISDPVCPCRVPGDMRLQGTLPAWRWDAEAGEPVAAG